MAKYKEITKQNIKQIREDLQTLMESFYITHGIQIELKNITYEKDRFTAKIDCTVSGAESREESDYKKYQLQHGLPELYSEISINGMDYKIVGFKPRSYKRPVLIESLDYSGKQYKASIDHILNAL